jgi:hypothetical protein
MMSEDRKHIDPGTLGKDTDQRQEPRTSGRILDKIPKGHEQYLQAVKIQKDKLGQIESKIHSDIFESTQITD